MTFDEDPPSISQPSADDGHVESWEIVAEYVQPFLDRWEAGEGPPELDEFLPDDGPYRREVLIELIKVDLEYRQQAGFGVQLIEDYGVIFPELRERGRYPIELITEEFRCRREAGETVRETDYFGRFPMQAAEIRQAFDAEWDTAAVSVEPTATHLAKRRDLLGPGDRIRDFLLLAKLGEGSFASVFLARQESMHRFVALKISADKGTEAQTLAQLDHPHIVRVFDQVSAPEAEAKLLYMQLAPGGTLRSLVQAGAKTQNRSGQLVEHVVKESLNQTGLLSPADVAVKSELRDATWSELACLYGIELAAALQYAHQKGVLHRDLKPANVLLDAYGSCKVADFNISFSADVPEQDAASSFGGSLAYMPPEQLAACHPGRDGSPADLDGRSDLFSLGVMLWEFVTGSRPYDEADLGDQWSIAVDSLYERRQRGPSVKAWNATDPVGLALKEVLLKCLEPSPEDRFRNAGELGRALALCREPDVASIVCRRNRPIKKLLCRFPIAAVVVGTLAPNIVAALFAWFYNHENLNAALQVEGTMDTFNTVQSVINGIAFPLAFVILVIVSLPLRGLLRAAVSSDSTVSVTPFADRLTRPGRRVLRLGLFAAWLGIFEWTIAAFAYPTTLHVLLGGLPADEWGHFIFSHVISGMIAAAYPFFLLSTVGVRAFLPHLLIADARLEQPEQLRHSLNDLLKRMDLFLLVAGAVPAIGVFVLVMMLGHADPHHQMALRVLSILGAFGFAGIFYAHRRLVRDVRAIDAALTRLSAE